VRYAQTDGKRIVYQCGAEIYLLDPAQERATRLAIEVPSHRTQAARKFVPAADHLGPFHVHPAGHSLAVDARGKVFAFPLWEGAVRQLGADDARYRLPQWLDDGATLVAVGDATREERVEVWENGGTRTLPWDIGRAVAMRAAPRGRR